MSKALCKLSTYNEESIKVAILKWPQIDKLNSIWPTEKIIIKMEKVGNGKTITVGTGGHSYKEDADKGKITVHGEHAEITSITTP
jgi:hypothetical protein